MPSRPLPYAYDKLISVSFICVLKLVILSEAKDLRPNPHRNPIRHRVDSQNNLPLHLVLRRRNH